MDSFSRYCSEMRDKGGAGDIASASAALRRRAAELLDFDTALASPQPGDQSHEVRFTDVEWLYRGNISLLGSVSVGDQPLGISAHRLDYCNYCSCVNSVVQA